MRSPVQVWSAAPLKNTPFQVCFFNAFLTHLRDLFLNRAWSLSSALGDQEYFVLSSPSLAVSSSLNIVYSRRNCRVFNECKVFCTHLHIFFEIVRGACRLRSMPFLASNPSSSLAVSSSMVYFVIGACRRRYRLFWFFNLKISWIFLYHIALMALSFSF